MPLDLLNFVRKWNASLLTERSAAPQHFRDLCEVLGVPHPTQEDEIGANYTFEKRVAKTGGGEGFADVWKRGFFAWEYKSKGGDLKAAYKQLNEYHEALDNPPLLVVCDFVRFEVHTKFENLPSRVYAFRLDDLLNNRDTATSAVPPLEVLRHVFGDFNQLRPNIAAARVTEAAAADFLHLAKELELEKAASPSPYSKQEIAHFLMRLVFCLFADSVGLLPNHTFRALVTNDRFSPSSFNRKLPVLFAAMSQEGGFFGAADIPYFNGDLFRPDDFTIPLNQADVGILYSASQHDWSHIEPAIFGTLFERSLDSAKRSMIGAHYTSPDDILLLIEPVVVAPLERRWQAVRQSVLDALAQEADDPGVSAPRLKLQRPALQLLQDWAAELTQVRILDPACGSGNFLYLALKRLLDLWHKARVFGIQHGLTIALDPIPHPGQLFGIETDFYAHEIASISVWIGFLQWKHDHGVKDEKEPLLQKLTNIEKDDAILRYDEDGKPYEPEWPAADFIVSNPPFLGDKLMRRELGKVYVEDLRALYSRRVPGGADLVTYWFEKARAALSTGTGKRVGLLATQGIRGGANRLVLQRIKETASIFWAHSDRIWTLQGAAVHVSMLAFDAGEEQVRELNGTVVPEIHSNLTSGVNSTTAEELKENANLCFIGNQKGGKFNILPDVAVKMLRAPVNPNGQSNANVIHPWANASDVTGRSRGMYIIDFGVDMPEDEAALYELPFGYVQKWVMPKRLALLEEGQVDRWWLHQRSRPAFRKRIGDQRRYAGTPRHSKHRFFLWLDAEIVPDSALAVVARSDDYMFGVLGSIQHEVWARAQGTQVREVESGFRYTPDSCFLTFPFPWPPGTEPSEADSPLVRDIAEAARTLVQLRDNWLNPPDTPPEELRKRTLTNLYNKRAAGEATWLDNAHRTLDQAVFAAYGWPYPLPTQDILARLLALNHARASAQPDAAPPRSRRTRPAA